MNPARDHMKHAAMVLAAILALSPSLSSASVPKSISAADGAPLTVSRAVATGFPLLPNKAFGLSTNKVDVAFSEPVDPASAQSPSNYALTGPVTRAVIAAVLDGDRPELVHLTLSGAIPFNAAFYTLTVTGVSDLAMNPIVADGVGNVGSFIIQLVNFQGSMKQRLCRGEFSTADTFMVEGNLAPLTFVASDNARMFDANGDSIYTTGVPISIERDRATGKADADLSWKFSHRPALQALEPGANRVMHLSSDNGASVVAYGSWAGDPSACLKPANFSFEQLDFRLGSSFVESSDVGVCRFIYDAPPEMGFFNLVARLPGDTHFAWVIRNVWIPDSAHAGPPEGLALRFPLSLLGVSTGTTVPLLEFDWLLSGPPLADPDTTQWFSSLAWHPAAVGHAEVDARGHEAPPVLAVTTEEPEGWYFPSLAAASTTTVSSAIGCNMPNLDLDDAGHPGDLKGCPAAACANSMKWLSTTTPHIDLPPDLRKVFDQLSDLMYRDTRRAGVYDDTVLVAKLDLIEAYGLPIRVKYQSVNYSGDIESTSGLTKAEDKGANMGDWPKKDWLVSEAADSEDVELCGAYYYKDGNDWVRAGGHTVAVTRVTTTDGKTQVHFKHDRTQETADPNGVVEEDSPITEVPGGALRLPTLDEPYTPVAGGPEFKARFYVESVLSESYDPTVTPPPNQHTFNKYCEEFRRTIPPGKKLTITYPNGLRCFNSTASTLDRSADPPTWTKVHEWNINGGETREFVNNTDHCITVEVHNDDDAPGAYTVNLAVAPAAALVTRPKGSASEERVEVDSSPSNPDEYGGFSLGGTSGGPDEFGSPAGPSVTVDASIGCHLRDVPGRLGAGVDQLSLIRPIPVWNVYWTHVGLHLVVSSVSSPGDLQVSCPSTGYSGVLHMAQPGIYEADLGQLSPTSLFTITLSAAAGLSLAFDAIGVPSLRAFATGVGDGAAPAAGVWNLGPTPSSRGARLRFSLPRRERVTLAVFDVTGREVRRLASGVVEAGSHAVEWNGADASGHAVASGLYFCSLRTTQGVWTTRIVVAR
jgi:hypothetical protein